MRYFNVLSLEQDGLILPTNSVDSAGYDLYAPAPGFVPPKSFKKIDLGFEAEFDPRYVCLLLDKSSVGTLGVGHLAGVIEGSYRDEWSVNLNNHSVSEFRFKKGQKIIQAVFVPHGLCPVKLVTQLRPSIRGKGGYGSTGIMVQQVKDSGLRHLLEQIPEGTPLEVALKTKLSVLNMQDKIPDMFMWGRDVKEAVNAYVDSLIMGHASLKVPDVLV